MSAAPTDFIALDPFQGPISSRRMFFQTLEDALYAARALGDADARSALYPSVVSTLEGISQYTADRRKPLRAERESVAAMFPSLRTQFGAVDEDGLALLERVDALCTYIVEWPKLAPKPPNPRPSQDDGIELPLIDRLDGIIVVIFQARGEMEESQRAFRRAAGLRPMMARAMADALRVLDVELDQILKAIDAWAKSGDLPPDGEPRATWGLDSTRQLSRYVGVHAGQIQQIRRSYRAWRRRAELPADGTSVSSFEQFVAAVGQALADAAVLEKLAPKNEGAHAVGAGLRDIQNGIRRFIANGVPPEQRDTPIAGALRQYFDLVDYPQVTTIRNDARMLADLLKGWAPEALPFFRKKAWDTTIELDILRTVSATATLDSVSGAVQQLVYLSANGKEPAAHERKQINLPDAIERELDIYAWPELPAFIARCRAVDAYWQGWVPPTLVSAPVSNAPVDLSSNDSPLPSRHDEERGALIAIENFHGPWEPSMDPELVAIAGGYSRAYFYHILENSAKDINKLPMRYPFSRALALQLRAMRQWTEGGQAPTARQQSVAGSAFAALQHHISGIDSADTNRAVRDARTAHAYFQAWPADDLTREWPAVPRGMIAGPDHFKAVLPDLAADAACLLVLMPNKAQWTSLYRQLLRMDQCARHGRALDASQREELDGAIAAIESPDDVFPNVPDFAASFMQRLSQACDYFSGRRARSRQAFDELLSAALDEVRKIQLDRNWDEDVPRLAAIDRQLRAMSRWSAGGRKPTMQERLATRGALDGISTLKGLDKFAEWAGRVTELATAFADGFPEGEECPVTPAVEIASIEEFQVLAEDARRDCISLSGRAAFKTPTGEQKIWDDAVDPLNDILRILEKDRVPSQRNREEIHRKLLAISPEGENPCPAIHDFRQDICDRLRRIDRYYAWLVTAGKYTGKEIASIDPGSLSCAALGGEMRLAFARTTGPDAGIWICGAEKTFVKERAGELEIDFMRYLPTSKNLIQVAQCQDWRPARIAWNAHSDFIAYQISGAAPWVGWCETRAPGERGRVNASAFAWAAQGSNFVAIDNASRSVFRMNAETGQRTDLVSLPIDTDPASKAHIAVHPGGQIMAFTSARAGMGTELSLVEYEGARPIARVRAAFPKATAALPFWGPAGQIACMVIAPDSTDIIAFAINGGAGDVLYHCDAADLPIAPAWSTTGKFIAFFQSERPGAGGLAMLDCDTRQIIHLLKPGMAEGRLSFGEETISIQDNNGAVVLYPHISHRRTITEKF